MSKRRAPEKTKATTATCLRCGRQFTRRRRGHVFCSRECRHRFEGRRVAADPEAIERLFDPTRNPKERVRDDDWFPEPDDGGWRDLYWQDTVAQRRRWYRALQADGEI